MELIFDDEAIVDLENIYTWIAEDSPKTAKKVVDRLFSSAELLISFPYMGHAGRDPGTFEWVVPRLPYIVVYQIDRVRDCVVVTAVLHGAQNRDNGHP
jgi:addiction module RelE/StbE family toxin